MIALEWIKTLFPVSRGMDWDEVFAEQSSPFSVEFSEKLKVFINESFSILGFSSSSYNFVSSSFSTSSYYLVSSGFTSSSYNYFRLRRFA